ncbi:MAG: DUF6049 family protein [Actinomycetota bacterium]
MTSWIGRAFAIVACTTVFGSALGGWPAPAHTQDDRDTATGLRLVSQSPWVALAGDFTLQVQIPTPAEPIEDVELRVRLYSAVSSVAGFERTVDGDFGARLDTDRVPLASIGRDARGVAALTFGLSGSPTAPSLALFRAGVYPLEVALVGEDTLESFVTWIVAVDADPAQRPAPVHVASVWPVVTDPASDVDGGADPPVVAELTPGGRLDAIATLVAEAGDLPLTLQIGPETLAAWSEQAGTDPALAPGLARVRDAATRPTTQLLLAPYVPIDLTALEAAGLGDHLSDQLVLGSDTLEDQLGETPDPRTVYVDPVDSATLVRLRGLLVDRVLVGADAVAPEADDRAPIDEHRPFSLSAGTGRVRAVPADDRLRDLLSGSAPAPLRAQQLLSALSVIAYSGSQEPSGVVLAMRPRWLPDLATHRALFAGLRENPLVVASTLDDLFDRVPAATRDDVPLVRELAPHEPAPFPMTGTRYYAAERALVSLRETIGAEDPDIARGERALQLAPSSVHTADEADTLLGVIDTTVAVVTGGVTTTRKRVVVPSRHFDVPLSFRNDTGRPITIRVQIDSSKLNFPDGNSQVISLREGNNPAVELSVEARASGTFPMTITLTSPDRNLQIGAPTRVTVRSAAFSGVGAALTVSALCFLLLWWGNHIRRTRRARRAATA